jgi:two-component system, chemotaxis family, chemotaxis protein CheY
MAENPVTKTPTDPIKALTVLIQIENEHTAKLLADICRVLSIEGVIRKADADAAWSAFKQVPVDVVMTDVGKPAGLTLIKNIRTHAETPRADVGIIGLMSEPSKAIIERARDGGVTELLALPTSPAAVQDRLRALLEKPREMVRTETYVGPSRRRANKPVKGERRARDASAAE